MDHSDVTPLVILATGIAVISLRNFKRARLRKLTPEGEPSFAPAPPSLWNVFFFNSPTLRLLKLKKLKMPWITIILAGILLITFMLENSLSDSLAFDRSLILTPETINWRSVSLAQFLHGGWSHLYNNVIALVLFGVIVENWMGTWIYLTTYLLGGFIGIWSYVRFMAPPEVIVLGASANISAIVGAYAVFRLAVWRRIYAQLAGAGSRAAPLAPQLIFYIYFVFGDDLVGLKKQDAGIAFGAHLVGSIVGVFLAVLYLRFSNKSRWNAEIFTAFVRGNIPQISKPIAANDPNLKI